LIRKRHNYFWLYENESKTEDERVNFCPKLFWTRKVLFRRLIRKTRFSYSFWDPKRPVFLTWAEKVFLPS